MIIFLYGEDSFRSRQKLKELKDKFIKEVDPSGGSLVTIDGSTAKLGEINEQISPSSLLVKKRMVVIEDVFLNKGQNIFEELAELLEKKKTSDNIIVFFDTSIKTKKVGSKESIMMVDAGGKEKAILVKPKKLFQFLVKQQFVQEFKALSNTEMATWIKREVERRGGQMSYQAINLLVSLVGNDLWQVNNEIEKLISYKLGIEPKLVEGGKPPIIEVGDVEELVRGGFDENIFALTDAISAKNKAQALKLLEEEFDGGVADVYLLTMIIRQFKILLQIRVSLDQGQTSRKMISSLKLHPFIVQKGINQVRNFSLDQLKKIISRLVEMDSKLKTGKGDMRTMLDMLFVDF